MDEQKLKQRLKIEASLIEATPSPQAWDAIRTRTRRRPRRLAVTVALAGATAVAVALLVVPSRPTVTDVVSPATSGSEQKDEIPPEALEALECFMAARVNRDFEAARPCMTTRLYESYVDPVEFIGPSSPNIQRLEVLGLAPEEALQPWDGAEGRDRLVWRVRAHVGTPTEIMFASEGLIGLVDENGRWAVDELTANLGGQLETREQNEPAG